MKRDLEIAKGTLREKSLTLSIVKRGKILYKNSSHGLKGLFQAVNKLGPSLRNASVADRIVGKAAAFLFVYSRVNSVFTVTVSEKALKLLEQNRVSSEFLNIVPEVLSNERTDVCPFERMVQNCTDAREAFDILEKLFE